MENTKCAVCGSDMKRRVVGLTVSNCGDINESYIDSTHNMASRMATNKDNVLLVCKKCTYCEGISPKRVWTSELVK